MAITQCHAARRAQNLLPCHAPTSPFPLIQRFLFIHIDHTHHKHLPVPRPAPYSTHTAAPPPPLTLSGLARTHAHTHHLFISSTTSTSNSICTCRCCTSQTAAAAAPPSRATTHKRRLVARPHAAGRSAVGRAAAGGGDHSVGARGGVVGPLFWSAFCLHSCRRRWHVAVCSVAPGRRAMAIPLGRR